MDRSSEEGVVPPSTPVPDSLKQEKKDSGYGKTQSNSNTVYLDSVNSSNVKSGDDSFSSAPDQSNYSPSLETLPINTVTESCVQSNETSTSEEHSLTSRTSISLNQQSDNTQSYTPSNDSSITAHQQSDSIQVYQARTQSNDTLDIVESSSLPNSDNSQLFFTPTDSIQSITPSDTLLNSEQDVVASDQDPVDQLSIATPPLPTPVNTGTAADLKPEQATPDWEFSGSELVCDVQRPSDDIKKPASVIPGYHEAVLGCEKPFPDSFNNQGDGYVPLALPRCPQQRIPNDVLRRETQQ